MLFSIVCGVLSTLFDNLVKNCCNNEEEGDGTDTVDDNGDNEYVTGNSDADVTSLGNDVELEEENVIVGDIKGVTGKHVGAAIEYDSFICDDVEPADEENVCDEVIGSKDITGDENVDVVVVVLVVVVAKLEVVVDVPDDANVVIEVVFGT